MSYTALVTFQDNTVSGEIPYQNSWGGAAYIWSSLFDRYLKEHEYDSWMIEERGRDLWRLADDERVPEYARVVLAFTFDRFLVMNRDFKTLAGYMRRFVEEYPPDNRVCHVAQWADVLDKSEVQAIGLHGTSVTENPWLIWQPDPDHEDEGEYVSVNIGEPDTYFDLFEEMKKPLTEN